MHASRSPTHLRSLDGIAVISDIVSSSDPEGAARDLAEAMKRCKKEDAGNIGEFGVFRTGVERRTREEWVEGVVGLMQVVKEHKPLAHQVSIWGSSPCPRQLSFPS
jgi:thiamine-phosphate diphosphorylase/hydroxyethylthiazole kinase